MHFYGGKADRKSFNGIFPPLYTGNYCTNLVDLNVNSTPVSNNGAFSLCGGLSTDRPGCTKLVKLNILYTMIDETGASYVLENLTSLRYLGFQVCSEILTLTVTTIVHSQN